MRKPNPCKKNGYVPLDHAIKHVLGISADKRVPTNLQADYRTILSLTIRPREESDWHYKKSGKRYNVRFENEVFHYEKVCCVHLEDFEEWNDYSDTIRARLLIRLELERLERTSLDAFSKIGFRTSGSRNSIFHNGLKNEINRFLLFAHQVEGSEGASEENIIAARIALALPELWEDFRLESPNPWTLSSRMAILCSAVPDPLSRQRLLKEKEAEIDLMKPDAIRGKDVADGSDKGGRNRAKKYLPEKGRFIELAKKLLKEPKYENRPYGWKASLSLEVVELMSMESPYNKDDRFNDLITKADSSRHWLKNL